MPASCFASPERGGAAKGGGGVQPDDRPHASRSFGRIAAAGRSAEPKRGNGLPCGGVDGECQTGASYEKHPSPSGQPPLQGGLSFPLDANWYHPEKLCRIHIDSVRAGHIDRDHPVHLPIQITPQPIAPSNPPTGPPRTEAPARLCCPPERVSAGPRHASSWPS